MSKLKRCKFMISFLPDSPFLVNDKLQKCNVCVGGWVRGGSLWVWMDMWGWLGGLGRIYVDLLRV